MRHTQFYQLEVLILNLTLVYLFSLLVKFTVDSLMITWLC